MLPPHIQLLASGRCLVEFRSDVCPSHRIPVDINIIKRVAKKSNSTHMKSHDDVLLLEHFAQSMSRTVARTIEKIYGDRLSDLLGIICSTGTKTLLCNISWNKTYIVNRIGYSPLIGACARGHLDIAKWLQREFVFTVEDVRHNSNAVFALTCENGHLEVAQWLQATFGLTPHDVRDVDNRALRLACKSGYIHVAQWLHATFALTDDDARDKNNFALRRACANGHLDVARWLQVTFGLTIDDARAEDNECLRRACANGNLDVVKWLHATFGLTVDDAEACFALKNACVYGHLEVELWLRATFESLKVTPIIPSVSQISNVK